MIIEGKVGEGKVSDGSENELRLSRLSELIVGDGLAHLHELVARGRVFSGCTPAAGVAPGTVIGTSAALALHNPKGSNILVVVLSASLGYLSGTLGLGSWFHCVTNAGNVTEAIATGTVITPTANYVGAPSGIAKLFSAATLANNPIASRPFGATGAFSGGASVPFGIKDMLDGEFVLPPGATFSTQFVGGAGTSPLCFVGYTWAEYPLT